MPPAEYLDLAGVAEAAGIGVDSARTYHTRATANRRDGIHKAADLPEPDMTIGGRPAWKRSTINQWLKHRPGRGVGGGRPSHKNI